LNILKIGKENPISKFYPIYSLNTRHLSNLPLLNRPRPSVKTPARINRNSKVFKTLINSILDKKGEKVVSLDLRKIPEAVADFFILCEASSQVQVKAIADHIEIQMKKLCDEIPYRVEGRQSAQWVLVDYVNIVVHIFQPETRKFYRLEEMWSDAVIVEHE
jgi:ribosome-associated protein